MIELVKETKGHSMCSGLWHFHRRTGKKDGRSIRRRHCGLCDCPDLRGVRRSLRSFCEKKCKENERSTVTFGKNAV